MEKFQESKKKVKQAWKKLVYTNERPMKGEYNSSQPCSRGKMREKLIQNNGQIKTLNK